MKQTVFADDRTAGVQGRVSLRLAWCVATLGLVLTICGATAAQEEDAQKPLAFVGSPYLRAELVKPAVERYVADRSRTKEDVKMSLGGPRDWLPPATNTVVNGRGDFMMISALDWKWRVADGLKAKLKYYPVARQMVDRAGKVVGSVEYGFVGKKKLRPVANQFLQFFREKGVKNVDGFVSVDTESVEFTAPDYYDPEPWADQQQPIMVHSVDLHRHNYRTTIIAELAKIRMEGYNGVMVGGQTDAMMAWAEENGMMLSGKPELTKENLVLFGNL